MWTKRSQLFRKTNFRRRRRRCRCWCVYFFRFFFFCLFRPHISNRGNKLSCFVNILLRAAYVQCKHGSTRGQRTESQRCRHTGHDVHTNRFCMWRRRHRRRWWWWYVSTSVTHAAQMYYSENCARCAIVYSRRSSIAFADVECAANRKFLFFFSSLSRSVLKRERKKRNYNLKREKTEIENYCYFAGARHFRHVPFHTLRLHRSRRTILHCLSA